MPRPITLIKASGSGHVAAGVPTTIMLLWKMSETRGTVGEPPVMDAVGG